MQEANRFLKEVYLPANGLFTKEPEDTASAFVPFTGHVHVRDTLCVQEESSATTTRCATRAWPCRSRRTGTVIISSRRRSGSTIILMANGDGEMHRKSDGLPIKQEMSKQKARDPLRRGANAPNRREPYVGCSLSTEADKRGPECSRHLHTNSFTICRLHDDGTEGFETLFRQAPCRCFAKALMPMMKSRLSLRATRPGSAMKSAPVSGALSW